MASSIAENEIRKSWEVYRRALLSRNGSLAIQVVDTSTLNYYNGISYAAAHATRSDIFNYSLIEKFFIFSIRHRVPHQLAIRMNGATMFSYGVNNGRIDVEDVQNTVIDEVNIFNDTAIGKGYIIGENEESTFRFVKEGDDWKIDISGVIPEGEQQMIESKLELNFKTDEDYIFFLLESGTGRIVTEYIWIPLTKWK